MISLNCEIEKKILPLNNYQKGIPSLFGAVQRTN